jgi:septation ring formation regulator EzrA
MFDREYHLQNLVRIENRIAELEEKILETRERIIQLEDRGLNTEIPHGLLAILVEHLEIMLVRHKHAEDDVRRNPIVGKRAFQTK